MTRDDASARVARDGAPANGDAAPAPRGRFLTDPAAIAALATGWSRLATEPSVNPVFLSPQWFRAWRDSFGDGLASGVFAIESGAETIGVMPAMVAAVRRGPSLSPRLAYRRGDEAFATNLGRYRVVPLRQLSPALGLECGNLRGGFAHAAGRRDAVRAAIARALAAMPGWDVAVLPTAADDVDAWTADAQAAGLRVAARPVRAYYATSQVLPWAEFLRTRSRHFRKRINPSVKRAAQLGLSFATRSGTAVDGPALAAFFALGARSWKQQGRAGEAMTLPVTDATRRFFTAIAAAPGDILPVLHEIRSGDEVKAAMLGLARDGVLVLCLTYFDPEIAEVWPGRLLFRECFDWSAANAIRQVDFNANHPGWARFADTTRVYCDLLLFRPGPVGAVLARLAARFAPPPFLLETEHEGMKVQRLDFDAFRRGPGAAWDAQVLAAPRPEPWSRLDWLAPWWSAFGTAGAEEILVAGDVEGALLLRRTRMPRFGMSLRVLEGWTNSQAMREPSLAFADAPAVAAALMRDLRDRRRDWDLLRLRGLPADGALTTALMAAATAAGCGVQVTRAWSHNRLLVGADWPAHYEATVSRATRKERRRLRRRLADQGELVFGRDPTIDAYLTLDERSWKAEAGEVIASESALLDFYRDMTRRFAARGEAEIDTLRVGGALVSGALSLVQGGRKFVLKTSYDEAYARTSPSWYLFEAMLEEAFARPLAEIDFCGRMQFSEWWTKDAIDFRDLDIYSPSLRGRGADLARRAVNRLRASAPAP